jgi:proteasome lid subunit RPN8/RPN11
MPKEEPGKGKAEEPDDLSDVEIETPGVWEERLTEALTPSEDPGMVVAACGHPKGEPRVYLHAEVLSRILEHTRGETSREVGGVLLGSFYLSHDRRVTDVRGAVRAPLTRSGQAHVTFSHDTWAAIFQSVDPEPGRSIVGWYHSHPNFGVFLSRQDVFIQENFFDSQGHIALVIDPLRHQAGVFKWEEGQVCPAPGFWISEEEGKEEKARRLAKMLTYRTSRDVAPGFLQRMLGRFRRG